MLAWEMHEWELHHLRGLTANMLAAVQLAARDGNPELMTLAHEFKHWRELYLASMARALSDGEFRRVRG